MTPIVVVKVGGSLLDWPALPDRLARFLNERATERLVVLVGGGRAADLVRAHDRTHGLGEERAHHLALHALDLTARLLADLMQVLQVVESTDALTNVWNAGRVPLLAPRRFLDDDHDPLPHSWRVTSDSIAARVAERLQAHALILLKSAPASSGIDRVEAARRGLVDPEFPRASRKLAHVLYFPFRDDHGQPFSLPRSLDDGPEYPGEFGPIPLDPLTKADRR